MEDLLPAIVGALIGVFGTIGAVFLTNKLERRRASDKEAFSVWRIAFDRPAFKGPYIWQSDQHAFRQAIESTIRAVNTGVLLDRQGVELGRGKGKAYIRDPKKREAMDIIERRLDHIRRLIPEQGGPPDGTVKDTMDSERNEIIKTLNEIWMSLGIPLLPVPTEVKSFDDVIQ